MANGLLVDSSYYIDLLRRGEDPLQKLARMDDEWDVSTCGMVVTELLRGFKNEKIYRRFERAFSCMIYIPTTDAIWKKTARLAWELDRKGRILPAQDILIAVCALSQGATVLTRDRHFEEIPGLQLLRTI